MKTFIKVVLLLCLTLNIQLAHSQNAKQASDGFPMVIIPIVDNTTGMGPSDYEKINESIIEIIMDKFVISESTSFPFVLYVNANSDNSSIDMSDNKEVNLELGITLNFIDLMSKQSFGEKKITVKGMGNDFENALSSALKLLKKQQKDSINLFLLNSYDKLLSSYGEKCQENLEKLREPSPMSTQEDLMFSLMSIPARTGQCKELANEELKMAYSNYAILKGDELNAMLRIAIAEKRKEEAEQIFKKLTYLNLPPDQLEENREALLELKIPFDEIMNGADEIKFDAMGIENDQLEKKMTKVLLLVGDNQMMEKQQLIQFKVEEINLILN